MASIITLWNIFMFGLFAYASFSLGWYEFAQSNIEYGIIGFSIGILLIVFVIWRLKTAGRIL